MRGLGIEVLPDGSHKVHQISGTYALEFRLNLYSLTNKEWIQNWEWDWGSLQKKGNHAQNGYSPKMV
jgi:hypothetical protein